MNINRKHWLLLFFFSLGICVGLLLIFAWRNRHLTGSRTGDNGGVILLAWFIAPNRITDAAGNVYIPWTGKTSYLRPGEFIHTPGKMKIELFPHPGAQPPYRQHGKTLWFPVCGILLIPLIFLGMAVACGKKKRIGQGIVLLAFAGLCFVAGGSIALLKISMNRNIHPSGSSETVSALPDEPFFIFRRNLVGWRELAPYYEIFRQQIPLEENTVLGTFPLAWDTPNGNEKKIICRKDGLYFPSPGEYYFQIQAGFYKVLILPEEVDVDRDILSITKFVSANTVYSVVNHSTWNGSLVPASVLPCFFGSDQPLKLWCHAVSSVLQYCLNRCGLEAKAIALDGHVVVEARDSRGKWVYLDPDYGIAIRNAENRLLSKEEIRSLIHDKEAAPAELYHFCDKRKLYDRYNLKTSRMPDFSFSGVCKRDAWMAADLPAYLDILKKYVGFFKVENK